MGSYCTKAMKRIPSNEATEGLKHMAVLLQEEVHEIMQIRDAEIQAYEREMMVFAIREAEWKKERKKLREEVKKLRKKLEAGEERFKGMENELMGDKSPGKDWHFGGPRFLLEYIRLEQARRDDVVEKWKQLYFAIKIELDDLIQKTNQGTTVNPFLISGEGRCWKAEAEDMLEEQQNELMAKEKNIELQQTQIASLKQEESKLEREIDILRQSLKIMCHITKEKKIRQQLFKKHRIVNLISYNVVENLMR